MNSLPVSGRDRVACGGMEIIWGGERDGDMLEKAPVKYCKVRFLSSFVGHGGTPNLQSGTVFQGLAALWRASCREAGNVGSPDRVDYLWAGGLGVRGKSRGTWWSAFRKHGWDNSQAKRCLSVKMWPCSWLL